MSARPSRRKMLKTTGLAALALPASRAARAGADENRPADLPKDLPKICLDAGSGGAPPGASGGDAAAASARRIRQLGVEHVISGGPRIPWEEAGLRTMIDRLKSNGLTLANLMISGFNNAIYNRPEKDADIEKVIQSIRAAGKVGLPVVEYNWYAHRAMEGYFEET